MTALDRKSMKVLQNLNNDGSGRISEIAGSIREKTRDVAARMRLLEGRGFVKKLERSAPPRTFGVSAAWTLTPEGRKFYRANRGTVR